MASRATRLFYLGETIRQNRDYFTSCLARASSGFLVQRNIQEAEKYLEQMRKGLEDMKKLEDPKISKKQEEGLLSLEMGCCPRN